MATLQVKNVRDGRAEDDGYRVLVDRLWPRGVSKVTADLDEWLKEVAPSDELRTWFHHGDGQGDFDGFTRRYTAELDDNGAVADLQRLCREHDAVTLVTGTADRERNNAVVLRDWLRGHRSGY